jgi:hypothetical protein
MFRAATKTIASSMLTAGTAAALAGDLNPPAGPVGPTMKSLTQVEPRTAVSAATTPGDADSVFRIASPGSYYLTDEVLVLPGKMGIEIASSEVTLDLNGFRIGGFAGSLAGVGTVGSYRNLLVRNGTIENCGEGINVDPVNVEISGCRVEDLMIQDCDGMALRVGSGVVVERVIALKNGGGIATGPNAVVSACTSTANGGGIGVGADSVVRNCVASGNNGIGFQGIHAVFVECTASNNGSDGFSALQSVMRSCLARFNGAAGFKGGIGAHIEGCIANTNVQEGIRITGMSLVKNNVCIDNGAGAAANILDTDGWSRIEDNVCINGGVGIKALGTHSVIVRNTCRSNTINWSIAANNVYGPIIDHSNSATPAVNGNAAAGTLATTDPNANFTH